MSVPTSLKSQKKLWKTRLSEPRMSRMPLDTKHQFATTDKEIITVHGFENYEDIFRMFLEGKNNKIFDYINNCFYFKTITAHTPVSASESGINALVSFIKTKFYKDELVLKKDTHKNISMSFINEAVISSIMTREYFAIDTPSFCLGRMLAAFTCQNQGYMIFERYLGPIYKYPEIFSDPSNVAYVVIQVLTTMKILQNKYRFTHYDLHPGNILVHQLSSSDSFRGKPLHHATVKFFFNGYEFVFGNIGYIVKIIDFGISRLETNTQTIYHHKYEKFSPYYDFAFFIHSIYHELKIASQKVKVPRILFRMFAFIDISEKLTGMGRPVVLESQNYEWFLGNLCHDLSRIMHGSSRMTNKPTEYAEILVV